MTASKQSRLVVSAAAAAVIAVTVGTPANANERRRSDGEIGAAVAIGVGALILGSVLAQKSHRDRYREVRHEPPRHRYSHPAPHVNRAPEYQNSGR